MKKVLAGLSLVVLTFAIWVYASHPWLGKTLSPSEVKERWGSVEFNEQDFKISDQATRAKIAFSLMTSNKVKGLTVSEVRNRLGEFDGHYFSESYPTYLIQTAQKRGEESWQIVFLIDKDRKTKEVIIHRNCCD